MMNETLSNNFTIKINKQSTPTSKEVLSNNFTIKINKQSVPTPKEVLSNNFTIRINKLPIITDEIFESIELLTDPDIIAGKYVRVAIRLKSKSEIPNAVINPKLSLPNNSIIKNIQWEKGTIMTDYRESIAELSSKSSVMKIDLDGITTTVTSHDNRLENAESTIIQNADKIEQKVSVDGVISAINQTAEEIKIQASKINLEGAVSVTNPTYSDRYIKLERDGYVGINKNLVKMSLGFKSPFTGQSDNTPIIAIGHNGIGTTSPYLAMIDYPATYNPLGLPMAFSEMSYQYKDGEYSSVRWLGNGSMEMNVRDYVSIGTYAYNTEREELIHISRKNGKGCLGVGRVETENIDAVSIMSDVVSSNKSLVLQATDKSTGVVLYGGGTKSFEPMEGQQGQIYNGTSWAPWKGVYSNNQYSSDGVVINDTISKISSSVDVDSVLDNIEIVSTYKNDGLTMDVTNIQHTKFVDVDEFGNVNKNDSELIKLLILEVKKLKEEIQIMKGDKYE